MIHIVFNKADVEVLLKSFELDENLNGQIFQIKDDFAVGPLMNVFDVAAISNRKQWWTNLLNGTDEEKLINDESINDNKTLEDIKNVLEKNLNEVAWIWAAQNSHDVCGYYWLMSQLKDYQGRVFILYLNNLPFINEKGHIFYPQWLYTIPPKEFLKAKKLARPITPSEFEIDPDEWKKICDENKLVRLLEGGKKILSVDENYYDDEIKKFITNDWQRAAKVIHQFMNKNKLYVSDVFILWRIKKMIKESSIDAQGNIAGMKDFEIKLKIVETVTENIQ